MTAKISNSALIEAHMASVQERLNKVKAAEDALAKAQTDLNTVRSLNGQNGCSVTVNGVSIAVAANGGAYTGYAAKLVRGRDMIHLGAIKALQALVDDCRNRLAEQQQELADVVARMIEKTEARHG